MSLAKPAPASAFEDYKQFYRGAMANGERAKIAHPDYQEKVRQRLAAKDEDIDHPKETSFRTWGTL